MGQVKHGAIQDSEFTMQAGADTARTACTLKDPELRIMHSELFPLPVSRFPTIHDSEFTMQTGADTGRVP